MQPLFGGIEAGGTKFVCAVGTRPEDVRAETRIPTTTPSETIRQVVDFFHVVAGSENLVAIGIASFGPIDPNPQSSRYGHITSTPKHGWTDADLVGPIGRKLGVRVAFDTDVNGAALGEHRWGAAKGLETFIYLTIGTGIGGGAIVEGQLLHGLLHPEMGHMLLARREDDGFDGICPYHGTCLEGLASGPAIEERWGAKAETLPQVHPAWELEAHYLAHGLVNLICALSPERIILGGGVMEQRHLFPMIREKVRTMLDGYVRSPEIIEENDRFIVPPDLGARAGVLGALALAEQALVRPI